MPLKPGSHERPLRVAIIGAGPSGFYAAGALIQQKELSVTVDLFDSMPAPYGLVRYGVAPDHQKIKSVTRIYEKTARDPRVRFFGNVHFGRDVTHDELRRYYDQIIYAVGSQTDRRLNIPGEDLYNSLSATEFVWWYNGHPEYTDLDVDLSVEAVAVIGVGNVAIDVARILAKSPEELDTTDITDYALERLRNSRIKDIYVLARRGPAQAKFTNPEIKEMARLQISDLVVDPAQLELDEHSLKEIETDRVAAKNVAILREAIERGAPSKERRVHFRFLCSPVEIIADGDRVGAIRIEKNELYADDTGYVRCRGIGERETIPVGLVLRSVGYHGVELEGVPFDARSGTFPNREGRLIDPETGEQIMGEYVVGWAKRGPSGVIGTNKPDAVETVERMVEDVDATEPAAEEYAAPGAVTRLLEGKGIRYVTFEDWLRIDQREVERGKPYKRPRIKFITLDEMMEERTEVPVGDDSGTGSGT